MRTGTHSTFAERNNATLSELRRENSAVVSKAMDEVRAIIDNVNAQNDRMVSEMRSQLESLKERLGGTDSEGHEQLANLSSPPLESTPEPPYQTLRERYNRLKESFRDTTTTLFKKEKVLLDSLKKTVLECHSYRERLDAMQAVTQGCGCKALVKTGEDRGKVKGCWCRFKTFTNFRAAVAKRAKMRESTLLGSLEKPRPKRRTRQSDRLDTP